MHGIEDLGDDLEAAERGHEVRAGVASAHLADELLRHLDADAKRAVPRVLQPAAHRLGDRDAGHLVVEELGMTEAVEREDAHQHGLRRATGALEE